MGKDSLTITDNRTGKTYDIPVPNGTLNSSDLERLTTSPDDPGIISYDPALRHTATCHTAITHQDPHTGALWYRGYPIEQLAEHSTYLEVAYLIYHGELPSAPQFKQWQEDIAENYIVHQYVTRFMEGFHYDAQPMGVLVSTVAALSTFFPEAANVHDPAVRRRQAIRLVAQVPTLACFAYRRRRGMPYSYPDTSLSYIGNFLSMMFKATEQTYQPHPAVERALDILFILHADHGQACSTTTMRCVGSANSDPYCAAAAAAAALQGRFHDEGFQTVLSMLKTIGEPSNVANFIEDVKRNDRRPPGFGHRLYRCYDPRARILRKEAERLFQSIDRHPLFDVAQALDDAASTDPYFIEKGLYPIVDYYEAILYSAMGFAPELYQVLFAIPRFIGWAAQWNELLSDPTQDTYRPRQVYVGSGARDYVSRRD